MTKEITILQEKSVDQSRDRCFCLILYCSSEHIISVLKRRSDFRRACWIVHDFDPVEDDDGNILPADPVTGSYTRKVSHVHLVVRFGNGHSVSAVRSMFSGYVDSDGKETSVVCEPLKGDSEKGALRYLIHLDDPNKYQYDPSEVQFMGVNMIPVFYNAISSNHIEFDPFVAVCSGLASGKLKYSDILLNSSYASVFRDKAWAVERLVKCLRDEKIYSGLQEQLRKKELNGVTDFNEKELNL